MNEYYKTTLEIIKTGHWFTDEISRELKEYDSTEPQFNVLRILRGKKGEPITVQEIQEKMVQRTSNVTRLIDKLIAKGLVGRQECATNRRKMDITITDKGLKTLTALDEKVAAFHQPMNSNLSKSELEQLYKLIKKLKGE